MKALKKLISSCGNSALAAALGLLLAACGGGEDASPASASVSALTQATPVAAATPVRVVDGKLPRSRPLRGVTAVDVAPDGSVAMAGADGSVQFQADNANTRRAMADPSGAATTALAFSADGKRLFSVGRDSVAKVWNVASRTRLMTLQGHEHPIRSVAVSADGAWVASAGEETRVMLWNAATGKLARILGGHSSFVNAVTFSPDGRLLASGDAAGHVVIWNLANGVPRHKLVEHTDEVNGLAFSPDGRVLASAGQDGRVVLWSAEAGQKLQVLAGHQSGVRALAFSRDGEWLATGGDESRVLVWDMATRTLNKTLAVSASVNTLVFDIRRRKDILLAGDEDGRVSRWDVVRGERR
jgi:dipeptidyl aminopeptidase/acylaminoacyl peptidase